MTRLLILCALLFLPIPALADGVLTPAANPPDRVLYDYRNSVRISDEFVSGSTTSLTIGALGWGAAAGTTTYVTGEDASRPGILRRDTTASSGTIATLQLSSSAFLMYGINSPVTYKSTWVVRLNTNDADTAVRIGFADATGNPPGNGTYFEKLAADTNWFCMTNHVGGSGIRVDTGIAVNTGWNTFELTATATLAQCSINGVVTNNANTQMTNSAMIPILQIVNSAAAAKTIDIDYFELNLTGLVR